MSETWMFLKAKKLKSFKSFTFTHFLYPQTHTCSLVPNTLHNLYYSSAWEVLGFEIHCRLAFQSCFYRHKSWSPQPRVDFWVFLWCFEYNLITLSCFGPLIGLTCRFPILISIYVSYYVEYWNLIVYVMNLIKSFGIVLRGKGSYLNLTSAWLDFFIRVSLLNSGSWIEHRHVRLFDKMVQYHQTTRRFAKFLNLSFNFMCHLYLGPVTFSKKLKVAESTGWIVETLLDVSLSAPIYSLCTKISAL